MKEHTLQVVGVAFSPDGSTLVSGSRDGTVRLWEARTGAPLGVIEGFGYLAGRAVAPDGIVFVSANKEIQLWNASTGQRVRTLEGHTAGVNNLALSADGATLASSEVGGDVWIWDVAAGQRLRELVGFGGGVRQVALSADGKKVALSGQWPWARVYDAQTGEELPMLTHPEPIDRLALSPDGTRLALTSAFHLSLWDLETGELLHQLTLPGLIYGGAAFSPDGKTVAAGIWDEESTICLWDVETGQALRAMEGHVGRVGNLSFSPDGTMLAVGVRDDRNTYLWEVQTGHLLRTLDAPESYIVRFSPDGKLLVLSLVDGTVRLWGVPPAE